METTDRTPVAGTGIKPWPKGFLLSDSPALQELLLKPIRNDGTRVNETKIRRLYLQASAQQWYPPQRLDFEQSIEMSPEARKVWICVMQIFYTLEKMGLNVISNMTAKAARRLKSEEITHYLTMQQADESRHVFVVENYLKKLGQPPTYEWKYHVLGQLASLGFYRVENWLFSTLFSENFASVFLRHARVAQIDPLGAELCKQIQIDESRHLHFLHIVLPDLLDQLSLAGRTYVRASQYFIMKFAAAMSGVFDSQIAQVGLNRTAILEEVFENVERAYEGFGVNRQFLYFPEVRRPSQAH